MERLIQYLDVVEDAWYAVALSGERLLRAAKILFRLLALALFAACALLLAFVHPPLALAGLALVSVGLIYRSAVSPIAVPSRG